MPTLVITLTAILTRLRDAIAPHTGRDHGLRAPVYLMAWTRIGRAMRRLEHLFALWQAGTLPRPRPSRAGRLRAAPARPRPYFPTRRAWLALTTDIHVRAFASQLRHALAGPQAREFLAAMPQTGRTLRPLCHMLGLEVPEPIRLPPHARKPRPPRPPSPRLREPERDSTRRPDRPLPDYVRAAARAWRKKGE